MLKRKEERAASTPKPAPPKESREVLVRVPLYRAIERKPPPEPAREKRRVDFTRLDGRDNVTKYEGEEFMLDRTDAALMVANGQLEYAEGGGK